jgi:hypothetical protein
MLAAGVAPPARAVRAAVPPQIDGRLDDAVWRAPASAPLEGDFVQVQPDEGQPASERTEVRVAYDARALYVAFRCYDRRAAGLAPRLGRRDNPPESDWVSLALDPYHDRKSAYVFTVTSAGVLADSILAEGQGENRNWDGVWVAAATIDADGWSAELEIPFSTIRFPGGDTQTWGFHVRRYISRLKEVDDRNLIRLGDASYVGRFEELTGLEDIRPGLSLQLLPYAAVTVRPSFASTSLAPRDAKTFQVGADLKYAVTGTLTLDATVNPEFGQVEVDPEVLNLTSFEVFFPEKRPFFLEGVDVF